MTVDMEGCSFLRNTVVYHSAVCACRMMDKANLQVLDDLPSQNTLSVCLELSGKSCYCIVHLGAVKYSHDPHIYGQYNEIIQLKVTETHYKKFIFLF